MAPSSDACRSTLLLRQALVRVLATTVFTIGSATGDSAAAQPAPAPAPRVQPAAGVAALGRILPRNGVRRISGPSEPVVVLAELLVDIGDPVKKHQVIARLDDHPAKLGMVNRLPAAVAAEQANIGALRATLKGAELDAQRTAELFGQGVLPPAERDRAAVAVEVAKARVDSALAQLRVVEEDLEQARIALERRIIRSPIDGQVIRVHTRAGEKVGGEGIVELGETAAMYAVAEVWESDIARVRVGQEAWVSSPVLPRPLRGRVERVAMEIGKKRVFEDDPAADRDTRVIEVEVRLDDSAAAATFTNLQVGVRFVP